MKLPVRLSGEAARILRAIPGLAVLPEPAGNDRGADAVLHFGGGQTLVSVQVKSRVSAATAAQLAREAAAERRLPLLLVAGETTLQAREILAKHGVAVVDGLGNAHIDLPGLLIHVQGRGSPVPTRPVRLAGKAGVIAQTLLLHPGRAWQVQQVAQEAQVSASLAHRVLARLDTEGLVATQGTGPRRTRRVIDPGALLDLWVEENEDRIVRTPAYLLAQTPRHLIREVGAGLGHSGLDYAFTGAAAGSLMSSFVTAIPFVEIWASPTLAPEQLVEATGAEPVTDGQNVVFLQAGDAAPLMSREQADGVWVVNRFRLYADLRQDPRRGKEQADRLRQEMIGF